MHRKTIAYSLFLIVAALAICLAFFPGRTYARYNSAAAWNTVADPNPDTHFSSENAPILTATDTHLTLTTVDIPDSAQCAIERLVGQSYEPLGTETLHVSRTGNSLTISVADGQRPPAGTYRLVCTWTDNNTAQRASVIFFINYSDV